MREIIVFLLPKTFNGDTSLLAYFNRSEIRVKEFRISCFLFVPLSFVHRYFRLSRNWIVLCHVESVKVHHA